MTGMRIGAFLALGAAAAYHVTRILAAQCSGARCDAYTGSVLLLALAVILAVVSGVLGVVAGMQRRQGGWVGLLGGGTLLGILVPTVGLAVLRNNPDEFVILSTMVIVLVPLVALSYSFVSPRPRIPA